MRKELIEHLAALAVADPRLSGIMDAGHYLVNIFREFGVLWYEPPENVTEYWRNQYGSDRPNWYTKPRPYSSRGKSWLQWLQEVWREALEFLQKETMPLSEGRLPSGIEQVIRQLLALAEKQGHEEKTLTTVNKQLHQDHIQVVKSLSGDYEFEYGILSDTDDPLLLEAEMKLKNLERGLRKLIHQALSNAYPEGWEEKLGLSENRLKKIRQFMDEERKKGNLQGEHSLLDFSDFSDLPTIVMKSWDYLGQWLKHRNETIIFLEILLPFRNVLAHRRPPSPSREDIMLAIGIASRLSETVRKGLMLCAKTSASIASKKGSPPGP